MVEFNQEVRIKSIDFMIGSCEYHLQRIKMEIQENFGDQEIKFIPEHEKEEAIEEIKIQKPRRGKLPIPIETDSSGNYKSVPMTLAPDKGKAIIIYEFNSFITDIMACVNYLVDLKLRLLDGYNEESSKTIGQYLHPTQNLVKNRGDAHKIIIESYVWIRPLKDVRNAINHMYVQSELLVNLVLFNKDGRLMGRTEILVPYSDPTAQTISILPFCDHVLEDLIKFKDSLNIHLQLGKG